MLKIIFITNILSRHQVGLWDYFSKYKDIDFTYLCTSQHNSEQTRYSTESREYVSYSFNYEEADLKKIILSHDIIFVGSIGDRRVTKIIQNKPNLVWMFEHFSKNRKIELYKLRSLRRKYRELKRNKIFLDQINKNNQLLCLSSYTGKDWNKLGFPKSHIFKFGYFPHYDFIKLKDINNKDRFSILWAGRFVKWKHPEMAIYMLEQLYKHDKRYHLTFVGDGPTKSELEDIANSSEAKNNILFMGYQEYSFVSQKMYESQIFLFSSDYGEGWGSVLGEAMSKGCFCFADKRAGSSSYLLDKHNGFLYKGKRSLISKIKKYVKLDRQQKYIIQINALETIEKKWNGKVAAERLYSFVQAFESRTFVPFKDGILSKD